MYGKPGLTSPTGYDRIIQRCENTFCSNFELFNQVKILHMSRQLSCRDMCKIVSWLEYYFARKSSKHFARFCFCLTKMFVKWILAIRPTLHRKCLNCCIDTRQETEQCWVGFGLTPGLGLEKQGWTWKNLPEPVYIPCSMEAEQLIVHGEVWLVTLVMSQSIDIKITLDRPRNICKY